MSEFMKVDLKMFDGEAAPSGEQGSETVIAPQTTPSSKANSRNPLANVVYGKQEDSTEKPPVNAQTETKANETDRNALYAKFKEEYKDLYGADVQGIVKDRLKKHSVVEQRMSQVDPIISMLMEKYGATNEQHLMQLVSDDTIEAYADRQGLTIEQAKETYKLKQQNKELQEKIDSFANKDQEQIINQQIAKWRDEETKMKETFPDFSLDSLSDNKQFMDLLAAGIEMKVIYQVMNLDSIIAENVKKASKSTVENIKARGNKITESGAKNSPGVIVKSDVNSMTKDDRAEINRRVARGERIVL